MKNLFILVLLGVFSVPAFGQQEVVAEQVEEKASEKVKVSDKSDKKEETKSSETKEASEKADSEEKKVSEGTSSSEKQVSEKTKDSKEEQVTEDAKPFKEEQVPEETKPAEEKQREQQPAKEEQVPEETKPVEEKQREQQPAEEKPAAVNQESDSAGSAVSVQAGVNYMCDEGRSYTLHEPGMDSENHLCELDAGHTESPVDWYALNQSSFCREKLQKIITLYNCVIKK